MTVKQIYDKLDSFTDEEREGHVGALVKHFTRVSISTLMGFQRDWDGRRPFEEFVTAQAKEIRACVELEIASIGQAVRAIERKEPLTWDTEIAA